MPTRTLLCLASAALLDLLLPVAAPAHAQGSSPWVERGQLPPPTGDQQEQQYGAPAEQYGRSSTPNDAYSPRTARSTPTQGYGSVPADDAYRPPRNDAYPPPQNDGYRGPPTDPRYGAGGPVPYDRQAAQDYYTPPGGSGYGYGQPYERGYGNGPPPGGPQPYYDGPRDRYEDGTYSMREILDTGHGFFGSVSKGLASVVEYAFQRQGRPNGYILGEDLGGAFIAGLRYGEGWLYTRDAGRHKVFWQGPSLGYDAGAEGSKVMVLVYNLRDPYDIYHRFAGVDGSAYVVGGVGMTFLTHGDMALAPIRSGLGLRFGANVGYLKYTRSPTWNPF